jgi:hypothetical protein
LSKETFPLHPTHTHTQLHSTKETCRNVRSVCFCLSVERNFKRYQKKERIWFLER